jgi:TolB-like protein
MRFRSLLILSLLLPTLTRAAEPTTKPTTILILRFAQLNDVAGTEWIGRVIQESLLTDTAKLPPIKILEDQRPGTTDLATARQMARDARADLVILGGYQVIADDLKITGQLLNVNSNEIIGTLKSTATTRDVLEMEDTLSRQLQRAITRTTATAQTSTSKQSDTPAPNPAIPDSGPVRLANYSTTYAPLKADPLQKYRDRNTYVGPPFYGYGCYYGYCGYGCGYYGCYAGFHGYNYPGFLVTAHTFYGD